LKRSLTIGFVVLLVALLGAGVLAAEPIRVGVLVPQTGAFAGLGADGVEGVKLAFEEINYEIAGRPVQLFFEDTAADPTLAVQKTQRLVEREKVQLILGPLSGGSGLAVKEFGPRVPDVTIIVAGSASEDITMRGVYPNVFRSSYSGAQVMFDLGRYAYEELGLRRIATLGEDYAFPHTQIGGFIAAFLLAGGEVAERFWVPMGTTDFSSIFPRIPRDIDAMVVTLGGTDAINFLQQFDEYGLRDEITIIAGSTTVDATILETAGHLVEGVLSGSHYAQELPYPEFKRFNEAFAERVGRSSSLFAADYYIAAQIAIEALNAIGGNIEDQDAFREALSNVKIDTPRGPFEFDAYNNVVLTAYINQVQFVDGEYKNVVIKSFPGVTQFGPFDPDWYESQPPFDRTNPTVESIKNAILAK